MNARKHRGGSGQALPLFVILVPALLAFMALGIDGANLFLAKRDAQGAADLAAVSGAKDLPDKLAAEGKAETIGVANGYTAAEVTPDADYGEDSQIEVVVTREVPTYFLPILNFFGVGDFSHWDVSARAVAQYEPGQTSSGDYALFSLEECGDKEDFSGLNWSGNNNDVTGSVHSMAGALLSGNQTSISGDFSVTCDGGNITDKYAYNEGGTNPDLSDGEFNPDDCQGDEAAGEVCRQDVEPPAIPFFDHATKTVDTTAISAACDYTLSNTDVEPSDVSAPGIYCYLGDKLVIKAGTYSSEVTFFAQEFDIADEGITMTSPRFENILFYAITSEEGKGIDYSGNNGTFEGIFYSPRPSSKVQFQGNGNSLDGALVGYRVDYSGENNLLTGEFGATAGGPPSVALIE